jgi:branched-chain amino acid transport system permease protein
MTVRGFWGPPIGSAIFLALQDYISSETQNRGVVYRPVFRAGRAIFPRGVLGIIRRKAIT